MGPTRYATLRNRLLRQRQPSVFAPVVLRDADSNYVPIPISERLVQAVWYDQRLQLDALRSTDGRPVRIQFPGWWNLEAGPDFRHATIQIGDDPEQTGDIEIHLRAEDWFHHGHDNDPRYNNVILHVVLWEARSDVLPVTHAGHRTPQLVLQHHLAAPLEQLADEIDLDAYPHNVGNHEGPCARLFADTPAAIIGQILDAAGDERFEQKARRYARWIHRAGAEQAFYEGWMEALGYKGNKGAFRALAQRLPLAELADHRADLAALLFGVAGFLPTAAVRPRGANAQYVKRLWSQWWKLRPDFAERVLPADLWRLHGLRPANHPQRRLGAAGALLKKHRDLLASVAGAVESGGDPARLFLSARDDFWSRHFTLTGKTQPRPVELIGATRANSIAQNVALPFLVALATVRSDDRLAAQARARFQTAPAEESNSALRLAAAQLFGILAAARPFLKTARRQQGLMQVFHDFCLHDKSVCRSCHFPELVQRWSEIPG